MSSDGKNHIRAFDHVEREDPTPPNPRGWIQWKGTDVCIDLWCTCGKHSHYDGFFLYQWECSNCGAVYGLSPHVRLVKLEGDEIHEPGESADRDAQ